MAGRIFPSRTIAAYTAKMFLVRTFAFLAALVVILQTLDLLGESSNILAAGNSEAQLWYYVSLRAPQIAALFLPFSVLLGTLVTLATLNQNSEVVIFKSAGISAHQILAPLIFAALGIAVLNFAFNETVLVKANATLDAWKGSEYKKLPAGPKTVTNSWVRGGHDLFNAETVTGTGAATQLRNVTIYDRSGNRLQRVIRATAARPISDGWRLTGVRAFDVNRGVETASEVLSVKSPVTPAQFTTVSVNADFVPFWKLLGDIREQRDAAGQPPGDQLERQDGDGVAVGCEVQRGPDVEDAGAPRVQPRVRRQRRSRFLKARMGGRGHAVGHDLGVQAKKKGAPVSRSALIRKRE